MPFKSRNQAKAFFAAAAGNSNLDIPQDVAKKYIKDSAGQKIGELPERIKPIKFKKLKMKLQGIKNG